MCETLVADDSKRTKPAFFGVNERGIETTYGRGPARGFRGVREAGKIGIGRVVVATSREWHAKVLSDAAETRFDEAWNILRRHPRGSWDTDNKQDIRRYEDETP